MSLNQPGSSFFSIEESEALEKILTINHLLKQSFIERDEIIDCLFMALIAREHILQVGPPGTGKSTLNKNFAECISGYKYFYKQLTKTTNPEELYGPFNIASLKEGRFERVPTGKIQEADIVDLDEVFNGNSAILNMNLSTMNERTFDGEPIPLKMMVGASNHMPKNGDNGAFLDRFMFRLFANPIHEENGFIELLNLVPFEITEADRITQKQIDLLVAKAHEVKLGSVEGQVVKLWQLLRVENVEPSDRRWKKATHILKVKALLEGREKVIEDDLDILKNLLWNEKKERRIVETTIMKSISPIAAEVADLYNQAVSISDHFKNLSAKNTDDAPKIMENLGKLNDIQDKIRKIVKRKRLKDSVRIAAQRNLDLVSELLQNNMKKSLGVSLGN